MSGSPCVHCGWLKHIVLLFVGTWLVSSYVALNAVLKGGLVGIVQVQALSQSAFFSCA